MHNRQFEQIETIFTMAQSKPNHLYQWVVFGKDVAVVPVEGASLQVNAMTGLVTVMRYRPKQNDVHGAMLRFYGREHGSPSDLSWFWLHQRNEPTNVGGGVLAQLDAAVPGGVLFDQPKMTQAVALRHGNFEWEQFRSGVVRGLLTKADALLKVASSLEKIGSPRSVLARHLWFVMNVNHKSHEFERPPYEVVD